MLLGFSFLLIVAFPVVQRKRNEKDVHQVLHKRSSHRAGLRTSQQKVKYFLGEEKRQLTCLVQPVHGRDQSESDRQEQEGGLEKGGLSS